MRKNRDWPDLPTTAISSICIHRLRIPMKNRVEHAASARQVADPIVVAVELQNGIVGYGETLPRSYVTGEDHASVERAIREVFMPLLVSCRPGSFSEALEVIEALPMEDSAGRRIPAARAGVELGLLDVYSRHFGRPIGVDVINWLESSDLGPPGCIDRVRCTGVIATANPRRAIKSVRKMRCYGLREFKLKVGTENQEELVTAVGEVLGDSIRTGRCSLRLDANGVWSLHEAIEKLSRWSQFGVRHIEQPLAKGDEENLPDLKAHAQWEIIHDESLVTTEDARRLLELSVADCFNIRISKCGGFLPSLKLVNFCRRNRIEYLLGCMVGQTSLLSAVERCFLQCVPGVRFVESNYGSFLLAGDVAKPRLRFGYGGKLKPITGPGWGVRVDEQQLAKFCDGQPTRLRL